MYFSKILSLLILLSVNLIAFGQEVPVESITINVSNKPQTSGSLAVGGSRTLVAVVEPSNATDKTVSWTSSNPDIIAFDKTVAGKIRGMRPGVTTITAAAGGATATYTVTVVLKDAKVGQYFFSDNTWEASGIVDGKTCLGVIFYLNPDNRSGKIVSLDEAPTLKWSTAAAESPDANSLLDGQGNLSKIEAITGWQESFDAEAWCVAKNAADVKWYLPAIDELRQLFAASCGLTWVQSGADESKKEIDNWTGASVTMLPGDNINPYPTERAAFNQYFSKIGATPLSENYYWSSTELMDENGVVNGQFAQFLSFEGGYSNAQPKQYFHVCKTRAIATFSENGSYSGIENIAVDNNDSKNLSIMFNTGSDEAIVYATSAIKSISVYNIAGVQATTLSGNNSTKVRMNVESLTSGLYIIVARTENGILSGKFLKR